MTRTRFCLLPAVVTISFCGIGQATAFPLAVSLPPRAIPVPLPNPGIPVLLGSWQDRQCLLLPPGVTPFEAVSDTIAFRQDGTFTQVINKATGRLQETGTYGVTSTHLTLNYLFGPVKPEAYEFSCKGEMLFLQRVGSSKPAFALDRGRS